MITKDQKALLQSILDAATDELTKTVSPDVVFEIICEYLEPVSNKYIKEVK